MLRKIGLLVMTLAAVVTSALTFTAPANAQEPDSSVLAPLRQRLDSYLDAISTLGVHEQSRECGFLISSCSDSLVRQYVTLYLYSHYMESRQMGIEAVAIDIADGWLLNGKVQMKSSIDLMNARIFADFNRSSLVGERAPELCMKDDSGAAVSLFSEEPRKRYAVLYFYDTGCATCTMQTVLLRTWLDSCTYPLDVYAVYTGQDSAAWMEYRKARLSVSSPSVRMHHLWDPDVDSDFQRKYGVLQTPQMLLVGKDNVILGRRLDVPALGAMVDRLFSTDSYEYGSDEKNRILSVVFGGPDGPKSVDKVNELSDYIVQNASSDPVAFKQAVGDMFYYLASQPEGFYREGAGYLADKYILSRPDVWDSGADTMKVVSYARTMTDLLSRCAPGGPVPGLKVRGTMCMHGVPASVMRSAGLTPSPDAEDETRMWKLGKIRGDVYVMLYDRGCGKCRENLAAADSLLRRDGSVKLLLVEVSAQKNVRGRNQCSVLDAFDLTSLPFIFRMKDGVVEERYLDFLQKL